jgi:hypothetical protein
MVVFIMTFLLPQLLQLFLFARRELSACSMIRGSGATSNKRYCNKLALSSLVNNQYETRRQPDQVERGRVSGRDMLEENELVKQ